MTITNPMAEKIIVALVSALAGGLLTYVAKTLTIEGRLDAIEKTVTRIESRLFPTTTTQANHGNPQTQARP